MTEMPDLAATAMQPLALPLWMVAALLLLLLITAVAGLRRSGSFGSVATLFGLPAVVVIAWSAWNFTDHAIRTAERDALNARAAQLAATATAPGSVLACLDAGADLAEACEQTLFQRPETVAAATNYTEARLQLLVDSLDDYVKRAGRSYDRLFVALRHSLEADRYGFVAHVLSTRESCTAESCAAFGWFNDTTTIKANIAARVLENNIARYAAHWPARKAPALAEALPLEPVVPTATISAGPVVKPIDFPSAASIPAVSIMTEAPPASNGAPAAAAPARKPPAPAPTPARAR